jgi:3-oxoacyl-[acyl-carrier-protein] synthase III
MTTKIAPMKMMTKIPLQKKIKNNEIISKATSTRKRQRSPTKTPEPSSTKRAKTTITRLTISLNEKDYKADKQTVEDTISAMENLLIKNTNDELRIKFNVLTQKTRCIMKMFDEALEKKIDKL